MNSGWDAVEGPREEILAAHANPIGSLARGEMPAIVLRGTYPPEQCEQLVRRLYKQNLVPGLPSPGEEIPARPEFERLDVGTSLGNLGREPDRFFREAKETHELFSLLFEGMENPIELLYRTLVDLAPGKAVMTAREPDGRLYGPAIIRCHMPRHGYPPHIDSVRKREKRTNYEVHRFQHQLAGIILLQGPEKQEGYCDAIQYRCPWNQEVAQIMRTDFLGRKDGAGRVLDKTGFDSYAVKNNIVSYRVELSPGDMYFFNSEYLHEVPRFFGHRPRIVLATFFGYSFQDPEVYVWS